MKWTIQQIDENDDLAQLGAKHIHRWIEMAKLASTFSEDPRKKVWCCAMRSDYSFAWIGFNWPPAWINIDWSDRDIRRARVIHWEVNCLRYCNVWEVKYLFTTLLPCSSCINIIASYKIPVVLYIEEYERDNLAIELAKEYWIILKKHS